MPARRRVIATSCVVELVVDGDCASGVRNLHSESTPTTFTGNIITELAESSENSVGVHDERLANGAATSLGFSGSLLLALGLDVLEQMRETVGYQVLHHLRRLGTVPLGRTEDVRKYRGVIREAP